MLIIPLFLGFMVILFWPLPYVLQYQQQNWQMCFKMQLLLFRHYRLTLGQKRLRIGAKCQKKKQSVLHLTPRHWLAGMLKIQPEKVKTLAWSWEITLGTGDPALTGSLCGLLLAVQRGIIARLGEWEGKVPQGKIQADFQNQRLEIKSDYILKMSLWRILMLLKAAA